MWHSSNELLEHAFSECQEALTNSQNKVEIILDNCFSGDINKLFSLCDKLEIKKVVEILRIEFGAYDIKSFVSPKSIPSIFSFVIDHSIVSSPLIWELTMEKKE